MSNLYRLPETILPDKIRTIQQRGDDGGDDGMWQQSVETRLSELRGDVQSLRTDMSGEFRSVRDRQERDFRLLFGTVIATALGIAGLMARGFGWIG